MLLLIMISRVRFALRAARLRVRLTEKETRARVHGPSLTLSTLGLDVLFSPFNYDTGCAF